MVKTGTPPRFRQRPLVIVMGVTGAGKSTIGAALAQHEKLPFLDADAYHPDANIRKMAAGVPLTDADRWPWLSAFADAVAAAAREHGGVIAACSALKKSYRTLLRQRIGQPVLFVLLDGDRETLFRRLAARQGHYMPTGLLDSQLATLEKPAADEPVLTLSIKAEAEAIIEELRSALTAMTGATAIRNAARPPACS